MKLAREKVDRKLPKVGFEEASDRVRVVELVTREQVEVALCTEWLGSRRAERRRPERTCVEAILESLRREAR